MSHNSSIETFIVWHKCWMWLKTFHFCFTLQTVFVKIWHLQVPLSTSFFVHILYSLLCFSLFSVLGVLDWKSEWQLKVLSLSKILTKVRDGTLRLRLRRPPTTTTISNSNLPWFSYPLFVLMINCQRVSYLKAWLSWSVCLLRILVPLKHWIKGLCAVSSILLGSLCSNLVLARGQEHWVWDGLKSWDKVQNHPQDTFKVA